MNRLTFIPPASPRHRNDPPWTVKLSCAVSAEGALSWGSELGGEVVRGVEISCLSPREFLCINTDIMVPGYDKDEQLRNARNK